MSKQYYHVDVEAQVLIRVSSMELVFAQSEAEAKELALNQAKINYIKNYRPIDGVRDPKVVNIDLLDRTDIFLLQEWERQLWEPEYVEPRDKVIRFLRGLPEFDEVDK